MEPIAPIDLSIGRPGTTTQIKSKETNQLLEERLEKLETNHKIKERDGKMLEIKLAQEIIDLKEGLSYVVSEVANAHQRIDDHEKEMKQLDLQRQFLWARVDELRVQMIPLETENNRTTIPIPGSVRALCSILEKGRRALIPNPGKENEQTSICEKDGAQLPNPGKEQISTHENNSAQIPNPGNESEQASATCERDSVRIANPNNERDQNEQAQMVTVGIERVWIPIAENERDPLLDNANTINTEVSLITTERADMAVKAVYYVNNPTEIKTVEQDTHSNVSEAAQCSTPSKKSTFSCKICLMEFSDRFNLRSHKSIHHVKKKRFLRKGVGSWNCLYCEKEFRYAKWCEAHEFSCTNSTKKKQRPVSSDSNEESIPTTENLLTIFPDSGTENGNHDMISALDISDSQVKKKKRRSLRKSIKESSSDKPSKELWKCNFCQKGFSSHERYRNHHEKRCPSRSRSNLNAVSAVSSVKSAQVKSLKHGRNKRYEKNPLECDVCGAEFRHKSHFVRHKLKHNPQNWMQCHDCEYRTHRHDSLALHIRSKHTI